MMQSQPNDSDRPLLAVVDDDESFLRSVARLLRSSGYSVRTFSSAREFLACLPGFLPQCLVLDMYMPEMSGPELQELLAAQGSCVPVILVTAADTPEARKRARRAGTFSLLLKPFDKEALLNAVEEAIGALSGAHL